MVIAHGLQKYNKRQKEAIRVKHFMQRKHCHTKATSMKYLLLSACSFLCGVAVWAQPLRAHLWESRPLILAANRADAPTLQGQLAILTQHQGEVTARDLVVYQIFPEYGLSPSGQALTPQQHAGLLKAYGPFSADQLTVVLIGKDGTVKLRQEGLVAHEALWGLIDGMPMRKIEMQREKKRHGAPGQYSGKSEQF